MSTRVVSESHAGILGGDDYTWVPSTEEFEALEQRLNALSRDVTDVSTSVKAAECCVTSQDKKILELSTAVKDAAIRVESVKAEIESELKSGGWKAVLVETAKVACSNVEERVREINKTMAGQISELAKHEVSARSIADELIQIREGASKEIAIAGETAKRDALQSIDKALQILDDKVSEMQALDEKLLSGIKKYEQLVVKTKDGCERLLEMRQALDAANSEAGALFEKLNQRGDEIFQKIDENAGDLRRLNRLDRRVAIQAVFMVMVVLALIVLAILK